eukprot:2880427-Prymnesium_polylepis.2
MRAVVSLILARLCRSRSVLSCASSRIPRRRGSLGVGRFKLRLARAPRPLRLRRHQHLVLVRRGCHQTYRPQEVVAHGCRRLLAERTLSVWH